MINEQSGSRVNVESLKTTNDDLLLTKEDFSDNNELAADRSSSTENFETPSSNNNNINSMNSDGTCNTSNIINDDYRQRLINIVLNEFTTKELKRLGRMSVRMLDYTTPLLVSAEEVTSNLIKKINAENMIVCDHIKVDLTALRGNLEDNENLPDHILIPVLLPGEYLGGEMIRVREFVSTNKNAIILILTQKLKIVLKYRKEELNFGDKTLEDIKKVCRESLSLSHGILNNKIEDLNAFVAENVYINSLYTLMLDQYSTIKSRVVSIQGNFSNNKNDLMIKQRSYYTNIKQYYDQTVDYLSFNMFRDAKDGLINLSYKIVDATNEVIKSLCGSLFNMDEGMQAEFLNKHINNSIDLFKTILLTSRNVVSRNEKLMNINLTWIQNSIEKMYNKLMDAQDKLRENYINQKDA